MVKKRSNSNKFGLPREIPSPTKRTVRQECGFGCIFCGNAIYQYENIIPFSKVQDHMPRDIALLCGSCHDEVTRGFRGKDEVRKARSDPYRRSQDWPYSRVYPNAEHFCVFLAGASFIDPRTVLRVLGCDLLSIQRPECDSAPIRLSADFYDENQSRCLLIDDNECLFNPHSWDIKASGTTYTILSAPKKIALRISLKPGGLVVDRMKTSYRGIHLNGNDRELRIFTQKQDYYRLSGCVRSPDVGIQINRRCPSPVLGIQEHPRTINLLGSGGDYVIRGRQPQNASINFLGGARTLVIDADAEVTVGGSRRGSDFGFAMSMQAAAKLDAGDLEVLVGAGARASSLAIG
jgi:hypothetical protein